MTNGRNKSFDSDSATPLLNRTDRKQEEEREQRLPVEEEREERENVRTRTMT